MDRLEVTERYWQETPIVRGWKEATPYFRASQGMGYIGGSFAAWMSAPIEHWQPDDIDIFAVSDNAAALIQQKLWHRYPCQVVDNNYSYTMYFDSPRRRRCQVIRPHPDWQKFPDDILNSFDFSVCRAVLINPTTILADVDAGGVHGKILRLGDPVRSLDRLVKYSKRGVQFRQWEMLKLFRAWSEMTEEHRTAITEAARDAEFGGNTTLNDSFYMDEDDYWAGE